MRNVFLKFLVFSVLSVNLFSLGMSLFNGDDTVECRIDDEDGAFYGDLSESMCAHLGGINMDELGLEPNPNYSGSIEESRYIVTEEVLAKAMGVTDDDPNSKTAIVQCKITQNSETMIGRVSRFMCTFLKGEEIKGSDENSNKVVSKLKKKNRKKVSTKKKKEQETVECRIEDEVEDELVYADLTRFMCGHLGGTVLNDLKLPSNPSFNGSIYSSRFVDSHPKAVIKCLIEFEGESIEGDLTRFMCNHWGGTPMNEIQPGGASADNLENAFEGLGDQN